MVRKRVVVLPCQITFFWLVDRKCFGIVWKNSGANTTLKTFSNLDIPVVVTGAGAVAESSPEQKSKRMNDKNKRHLVWRPSGKAITYELRRKFTCTHTNTRAHARTRTHTHTREHKHMHKHTHTYMQKHTHTHTHLHTHIRTHVHTLFRGFCFLVLFLLLCFVLKRQCHDNQWFLAAILCGEI